jgi:hypothetical protein
MKAIIMKMQANIKTTLTIIKKTTHRSKTTQTKPPNTQQQPSAARK